MFNIILAAVSIGAYVLSSIIWGDGSKPQVRATHPVLTHADSTAYDWNHTVFWKGHLPFPVTDVKRKLVKWIMTDEERFFDEQHFKSINRQDQMLTPENDWFINDADGLMYLFLVGGAVQG